MQIAGIKIVLDGDSTDRNLLLEPKLAKHKSLWASKLTSEENATMELHINMLRDTGALFDVLKRVTTLHNSISKISL